MIRIVIPTDPHRLSNNQRLHWAARSQRNKVAKKAALGAWMDAGGPRGTVPVSVAVLVRRGRTIDNDNAITGLKPVFDVLFCGRITPDDSPKWVQVSGITQEVGKRWKDAPEVVLEITERAG